MIVSGTGASDRGRGLFLDSYSNQHFELLLMSTKSTSGDSGTSPRYSRGNWWGDQEDEGQEYDDPRDTPETNPGPAGHWRPDPNDPEKILAHKLLRETGTLVCATTLYDDAWNGGRTAELFAWLEADRDDDGNVIEVQLIDGHGEAMHHENGPVELTDPSIKLPKKHEGRPDAGCERHRRRINPETGYINGGESTATVIEDRPVDKFMGVVEDYLDLQRTFFEKDKKHIRDFARSLKCNQHNNDMDDEVIMARIISEVREQRNRPQDL